jgi:UDP-N-acetylmuramate--alanine ligase
MNYLIKNSQIKIFFIGIGGIGMSGIAELMSDQGYKISGSDLIINNNIKRLNKKGIKIYIGHKKTNIKSVTLAVFSSAIKNDNPEIKRCKELKIPLLSRADMLAELMRFKKCIAVAGSHGKTTTTSLVGSILEYSKLDPTIVNGGIINAYSKNNRLGKSSLMVVESDESDGSFLKLPHEINIITNIDIEHLDYYKTKKNILNSFEKFITSIPFYGYSILCISDLNTYKISKKIDTRKIITYGYELSKADVRISNIYQNQSSTSFKLLIKKNIIRKYSGYYNFNVNLLGVHNVLNATGAIIASLLVGAKLSKIKKSLNEFKGIKRRFTFIGKKNEAMIYDDYAHHPTEIQASYEIAKHIAEKRIIVIFQPHRFSRTRDLYDKFIKVLKRVDILYIYDIYPAGEKKIKNINSVKLVKDLKIFKNKVYYLNKSANLNSELESYFYEKNLIIFMGAGSITNEANKLVEKNDRKIKRVR